MGKPANVATGDGIIVAPAGDGTPQLTDCIAGSCPHPVNVSAGPRLLEQSKAPCRHVVAQQPAVVCPDEHVAIGERAEGQRDCRPTRTNQTAERFVGQREPDHRAFPLPAKIRTELLDPIAVEKDPERVNDREYVNSIYREVESAIQDAMGRLAKQRRFPIFG